MRKEIKVRLCGTFHCCPTIKIGKKFVEIADDFGGNVRLTRSQWSDFKKKIGKL